jgi:hypothetical protein
MPWLDDEDPCGEYLPVRVFWDHREQKWSCRCLLYELEGRCPHLVRYRKVIELTPKERYL